MKACNWLTVSEMVDYYSLTAMWKITRLQAPEYMSKIITLDEEHKIVTDTPRLKNTKSSFRWRTQKVWNKMDK